MENNYEDRFSYNKYGITITKPDEYQTKNFSINWWCIRLWSLDSFRFEISFVADTHWGIGVIGILPYLRWVIAIPCPEKLAIKINNVLDRKPQRKRGQDETTH